jgi:hypothetical protein
VTKLTAASSDDWMYQHFGYTHSLSLNYNYCSGIAVSTLYNSLLHTHTHTRNYNTRTSASNHSRYHCTTAHIKSSTSQLNPHNSFPCRLRVLDSRVLGYDQLRLATTDCKRPSLFPINLRHGPHTEHLLL